MCNVEILDEAELCPLCHSVLEKTEDMENVYPDVRLKSKFKILLAKIYLFLAIATEMIIIGVCLYNDYRSIYFTISGFTLLYGYAIIKYAIVGKRDYKYKILGITFVTIVIMLAIDYVSGFYKWSMNYVLPGAIIFIDAGILILMIINRRNWQSYIIFQVFMILVSLGQFILYSVNIITNPLVAIISAYISCFLFLGTFIIGGRRARVELIRRFHI